MTNLEEKVIKHDEQIKTLFNNVGELRNVTGEINRLALSIEKIAMNQTSLIEQTKQLREDVDNIKEQPAKDAHETKQKIINAIITTATGLIVGALITLVAMVIAKGGI